MVRQVVQSVMNVRMGSRIPAHQELIKMNQIKPHVNNVHVEFIVKLQEVTPSQVTYVPMDTFVKRVPRENIPPRIPPEMTTMVPVLLVIIVKLESKLNVVVDNIKTKLIKVHVKIVLLVSFVMELVLKHLLVLNVLLVIFVLKGQQARKHAPKELIEVRLEQEAVQIVNHVKAVTFVVQALPNLMVPTYALSGITASSEPDHSMETLLLLLHQTKQLKSPFINEVAKVFGRSLLQNVQLVSNVLKEV